MELTAPLTAPNGTTVWITVDATEVDARSFESVDPQFEMTVRVFRVTTTRWLAILAMLTGLGFENAGETLKAALQKRVLDVCKDEVQKGPGYDSFVDQHGHGGT